MAFSTPVLNIRRNVILKRLGKCGALSAETAKTLSEAGVTNPCAFPHVTEHMVSKGIIRRTEDGKYYL